MRGNQPLLITRTVLYTKLRFFIALPLPRAKNGNIEFVEYNVTDGVPYSLPLLRIPAWTTIADIMRRVGVWRS